MPLSIIDILFLITVVLMVLNGLRNGFVFSLINLVSIPLALGIAYFFGPQFTAFLVSNNLPATPLIAYIVLFFAVVLVLHAIASFVRGVVQKIPVINLGDSLLGALVGFAEAWLLWLFLLIVLGSFLHGVQSTVSTVQSGASVVPGVHVPVVELQQWHDLYNQAVSNSLFARVNGFFVKTLPNVPNLPQSN